MSRKVALIPEELISSHHYQDPELRLEDHIGSLLDLKKSPDDMKVKPLSQLVLRYQKTLHTPPEPTFQASHFFKPTFCRIFANCNLQHFCKIKSVNFLPKIGLKSGPNNGTFSTVFFNL